MTPKRGLEMPKRKRKKLGDVPEVLETDLAASLLGVIPRRVRAMCESGQLPAAPWRKGTMWSIKRSDLLAYMKDHDYDPKAPHVKGQPRRRTLVESIRRPWPIAELERLEARG
jgi:hypothetical protein